MIELDEEEMEVFQESGFDARFTKDAFDVLEFVAVLI